MDALEERGLPLHGTWPHLAQRLRHVILQELGSEVRPSQNVRVGSPDGQ